MTFRTRFVAPTVALLVASVLLGGCIEDPLTQEQAEARTETAMASFAAAMSNREGGGIKVLDGTMEAAPGDGGDDFMPGDMNAEMRIEWGANGVVHAEVEMVSGGFTISVESWCTTDRTFLRWGGEVYESRASSGEGDEDLCRGFDEAEMEDGMMFLDGDALEGLEKGEVTINDDGTITAVYSDPEEDATMTITIDRDGRVSRFEMTSPEASGVFDVRYGARDQIALPEPTGRIPASVWADEDNAWDSDEATYTVRESPERPPLADMEARWVEEDWEQDDKAVLATFTLTDGRQTRSGITFEYFDVDGDGRVSVEDRYEVVAPTGDAGGDQWSRTRSVELYDLWAEGYVNESPIPAPGLVGLLAVLGVALLLLRRR